MKRIYRKVDPGLLNDEKYMSLSTEARLIFVLTLVHPNLTSVGAMRATVDGLIIELWGRHDLSKPFAKGLPKRFDELFRNGLVKYDERVGFWWFPNWIKYNLPENPNIVKSWEKAIAYLPECDLRNELIYKIQELGRDETFGKWLPKGFVERFAKPFRNGYPNPLLNHITITNNNNNNNIMPFCNNWFDEFWEIYPKKDAKKEAKDLYCKKVKTEELHKQIIEAVKLQILDREYAKRYGVFHAEWAYAPKFLRKERWNDPINGENYYNEKCKSNNSKNNKVDRSSYNKRMEQTYYDLQSGNDQSPVDKI